MHMQAIGPHFVVARGENTFSVQINITTHQQLGG
jgi:hypothetical protein